MPHTGEAFLIGGDTMLKACSKCGKIHPHDFVCTANQPTPEQRKAYSNAEKFRGTEAWKRKARAIRKRDMQMCQCCRYGIHNPRIEYNSRQLSVHHIRPLETNFDRRLDDDNLITLCRYHHELAERGIISARQLAKIIENNSDFSVLKQNN